MGMRPWCTHLHPASHGRSSLWQTGHHLALQSRQSISSPVFPQGQEKQARSRTHHKNVNLRAHLLLCKALANPLQKQGGEEQGGRALVKPSHPGRSTLTQPTKRRHAERRTGLGGRLHHVSLHIHTCTPTLRRPGTSSPAYNHHTCCKEISSSRRLCLDLSVTCRHRQVLCACLGG